MGRIPEVVLRGRGIDFRLEAYVVRVVRGRTTWTVPLAAIDRVEYTGRRVLLELSGDATQDGAFTLITRNATAADAFVRRLRTALTRLPAPGQGPTHVVRETVGRRIPRLSNLPTGAKIALGVVPYLAFFSVAGDKGAEAGIGDLVGFIMLYGPAGWLMLYFGWTEVVRDALILRRRGITVPGRIRDYTWRSAGEDSGEWHPVYEFRTLEGQRMVVTQTAGHGRKGERGPVDVTYDPLSPTRVRGLRDKWLTVRGIVLTFFGVLSVLLMLIPLWLFISALLTA
ncbi:DUF3592 domain-containing protein [Streptomyces albofaciens]|uniref:DUF3592 domain-containing protein n=1 Tax=Streptomyces albofaciens TaxID=66866 RepID=UPI00123AB10B|nr:DUF3592 domain-containing protein [Streptomyces albofaciens]